MKKILKNLKRKITVLAVAMIAIQPAIVGGMMMPLETQAAAPVLNLTANPASQDIAKSVLLAATGGKANDNSAVTTAVSGLTPIAVTLTNTGTAASANVRISPVGAGANIQLWAKDSANDWYDINVTGWGPGGGFPAPIGYNATTNVYAISDSDAITSYPLTVNLVLVSNASVVASTTGTVTVVDTTAPVVGPHPNESVDSTSASGAVVNYAAPVAVDSIDGPVPVTCSPLSDSTFPIGVTPVTCSASDAAGNVGTSSFTVTVNDKAAPTFKSNVTPSIAGPGIKTVDIEAIPSEALVDQPVPAGVLNKRVIALGATYGVKLVINEVDGDPLTVYVSKNGEEKYVYTHTIETLGKKTVNFDMTGTDLAGNPGAGTGSFVIDNVVLSPQVTTPTTTVVNAVATVPVDDQYGGDASSEQGEVKADTTVKADDGNNSENKDEKKEDTKGKQNIPLWGIIFLLILAGVGGYLFYSQNPEKANGKK